jgi:hypothetical protein
MIETATPFNFGRPEALDERSRESRPDANPFLKGDGLTDRWIEKG